MVVLGLNSATSQRGPGTASHLAPGAIPVSLSRNNTAVCSTGRWDNAVSYTSRWDNAVSYTSLKQELLCIHAGVKALGFCLPTCN